MSGSTDDAYDLSQESFLKAWRALGQYQFEAGFSTWLFRLTSNVCIDFLRRRKRESHVSLTFSDDEEEGREYAVPDPAPLPEQTLLACETREELMDNFRRPYFAATIRDFWRRWHISLSTWFRDYLYIPLGGSRKGKLRTWRNIMSLVSSEMSLALVFLMST